MEIWPRCNNSVKSFFHNLTGTRKKLCLECLMKITGHWICLYWNDSLQSSRLIFWGTQSSPPLTLLLQCPFLMEAFPHSVRVFLNIFHWNLIIIYFVITLKWAQVESFHQATAWELEAAQQKVICCCYYGARSSYKSTLISMSPAAVHRLFVLQVWFLLEWKLFVGNYMQD